MLLVEHTLTLALSSFLPSFSAHLPPFSLPFLPLPAALLLSPSFFSFVSLILSQYIAQAGPELAILLCQSVCRDGRPRTNTPKLCWSLLLSSWLSYLYGTVVEILQFRTTLSSFVCSEFMLRSWPQVCASEKQQFITSLFPFLRPGNP